MSAPRLLIACAGLLLASGCQSAYQRTYERETQRLEQQHQEEQAQEAARHGEASRYAAVVYFKVGSTVVDADGQRQLRWFVDQMRPYPEALFLVQGFADSTGDAMENQTLSEARARAVGDALIAQGIDASRLTVQGFGTGSPAARETTAEGRRKNRRVEVTVR